MSIYVEMSRSWSSAHDWKSCRGQKLLESSNLSISAMKHIPHRLVGDMFHKWLERFEKGTSAARETCRGHVSVPECVPARCPRRANLSISAMKHIPHRLVGDMFHKWLERFEKGTSAARETCRGHVSVPECVPARCPRRANLSISAKNESHPAGVAFIFEKVMRRDSNVPSHTPGACASDSAHTVGYFYFSHGQSRRPQRSHCPAKNAGESLHLRHKRTVILIELPFFLCYNDREA